jgi:hypothetical protein
MPRLALIVLAALFTMASPVKDIVDTSFLETAIKAVGN